MVGLIGIQIYACWLVAVCACSVGEFCCLSADPASTPKQCKICPMQRIRSFKTIHEPADVWPGDMHSCAALRSVQLVSGMANEQTKRCMAARWMPTEVGGIPLQMLDPVDAVFIGEEALSRHDCNIEG